ncbi:uncharacterized protein EV420DRAFT_1528492 [Desarmillaria tabescens]|uniref:BTB domain-containing protein n=1 Tax=Armillaria tabescens TaxID=1929756 RepID=A0AA39NAI3_ARMTA|nr:uncharacterized protein EV420DRAFT_1528492 [Desarmillaria tabescens]KAK0462050.1 hypothetical protein EV420DRAFT_1528492 [Desarmillaria tabescens]
MDAPYSFDGSDTTADVILISSDDVRFHAHKLILSLASPFFKDMFALAQAPTNGTIPTVPMAEDGEIIDQILRFCYPTKDPSFGDISALYRVMVVMARKYIMEDVVIRARSELRKFSNDEPLRVFAIAYAMGWKDEAKAAANRVLKRPLLTNDDDDIPELDLLQSPRIIYRLLKFHEKRLDEAHRSATFVLDYFTEPLGSSHCSAHSIFQCDDGVPATIVPQRSWLLCYVTAVQEIIRRRPNSKSLRIQEKHHRWQAQEIAESCPECVPCDLPAIFDEFIPDIYLVRIEEILNRKFDL